MNPTLNLSQIDVSTSRKTLEEYEKNPTKYVLRTVKNKGKYILLVERRWSLVTLFHRIVDKLSFDLKNAIDLVIRPLCENGIIPADDIKKLNDKIIRYNSSQDKKWWFKKEKIIQLATKLLPVPQKGTPPPAAKDLTLSHTTAKSIDKKDLPLTTLLQKNVASTSSDIPPEARAKLDHIVARIALLVKKEKRLGGFPLNIGARMERIKTELEMLVADAKKIQEPIHKCYVCKCLLKEEPSSSFTERLYAEILLSALSIEDRNMKEFFQTLVDNSWGVPPCNLQLLLAISWRNTTFHKLVHDYAAKHTPPLSSSPTESPPLTSEPASLKPVKSLRSAITSFDNVTDQAKDIEVQLHLEDLDRQITTSVQSNLVPLLERAKTHGASRDLFSSGEEVYSLVCKKDTNGNVSVSITPVEATLKQAFAIEEAQQISKIMKENLPIFLQNQGNKSAKRVFFDFEGKSFSIKIYIRPVGPEIEVTKMLGKGTFKEVPRRFRDATAKAYVCAAVKIRKEKTRGLKDSYQGLRGWERTYANERESLAKDLKQELDLMKKFTGDPHIIQCYKTFEKPLSVFPSITVLRSGDIEECDGGTAKDFCTSPPKTTEEVRERIRWVLGWAKGLQSLIEKGYCHNDIKPDNLFLATMNGQLEGKIGDLGAAGKEFGAGSTFTPLYISPENTQGGFSSEERDVWAFGMSLLELMKGENANPLRKAKDYLPIETLRQTLENSSYPMDRLIGSMLRADRNQRPWMIDVVEQLEQILINLT
jgi:hypothetical protein